VTTHGCICSAGKTIFPNFMLAQLISAHQVVLLCDASTIYLFYHNQVYSRPTASGFSGLPARKGTLYCPIWALIDMDCVDKGPPIVDASNIWPIQTSSNPTQWNLWLRHNQAALLGMPLWDMKELTEGYVFGLFSLSAINPGNAV
jgi:hypothetical protein